MPWVILIPDRDIVAGYGYENDTVNLKEITRFLHELRSMILSNISFADILIFLIFLAPQLLLHIPIESLMLTVLYALPHLVLIIPYQLIKERYFTSVQSRSPFVQRATFFQDVVVRCVRYAFANMPASIGAVFFSKGVALPFMRFRMLRHGYFFSPIHYEEVMIDVVEGFDQTEHEDNGLNSTSGQSKKVRGVWMIADKEQQPDVCVYYLHGGGFSMGSCYFYLEFLMAWLHLLRVHTNKAFHNPAVLALDYTLVPEETYPRQLWEVISGYRWLLNRTRRSSSEATDATAQRICVAGDSAGATLSLSLLLRLASSPTSSTSPPPGPGFATLISPWPTLVSHLHTQTASDYLNEDSLHLYARQYIGDVDASGTDTNPILDLQTLRTQHATTYLRDPVASPGTCQDVEVWRKAWPKYGWHFCFGREEVLGEDARSLIEYLRKSVGCAGVVSEKGKLDVTDEEKQIHAWPVVQLFLGEGEEDRLAGLNRIVDVMVGAMGDVMSDGNGVRVDGQKTGGGGGRTAADTAKRRKI